MKHSVSISNLKCGDTVGYKKLVTGRVKPNHSVVQVLVRSADNQWYTQQDATVARNGRWKAEVTFGFPTDSLHEFTVVATAGEKIKTSPLPSVPDSHTVSAHVTVTRVE